LTSDDIDSGGGSAIDNPLARALQRATGRLWFVWESNIAYEMRPPYRNVPLPASLSGLLHRYLNTGLMKPLEFEIELDESVLPQTAVSRAATVSPQPQAMAA